jgi:hypothetical protein
MRLPRVRLSVRRLMAAVAVVAVLTAAPVTLQRRAARFRALADEHKKQTEGVSGIYYGHELDRVIPEDARTGARLTGLQAAWHLWHARLGAKYARAASRPWLPVGTDPPEPSRDPAGDLVALGGGVFFTAHTATVEAVIDRLQRRAPDHPEFRGLVRHRWYFDRRGGWYFDDLSPDALRLLGRLVGELAEDLSAIAARADRSEGGKAVVLSDVERFRGKLAERIARLE